MGVISIYKYESLPDRLEVVKELNGKKVNSDLIIAKLSRYNRQEVVIQYFYYESVEDALKRVLPESDSDEVVSFLRQNGKTKVLRKAYCFINILTKTLEVYRGQDSRTDRIVSTLEQLLNTKFTQITLDSQVLQKIYTEHGVELKQAMFKNIHGLFYEILRGKFLESNNKFKEYLNKFPEALRVISFRPKIKFLNSYNKYQVTINGDRGTIRFSSSNGLFKWRPRLEVRQITFLVAATLGLLAS
ncbi:MAG: hypothetical protein QMD14_05355 [Candidatus Aenigmarchaeota archaeon]|nr:hypothetical protein [Candidatus Aenigmarchaeota archaeon]